MKINIVATIGSNKNTLADTTGIKYFPIYMYDKNRPTPLNNDKVI